MGIPRPTWLIRSGGVRKGRPDEGDYDGIFSPSAQGVRGGEPRPRQQRDGDGQLECQPEGEHEFQDEREVLIDLRLELDRQAGIDGSGLEREEETTRRAER